MNCVDILSIVNALIQLIVLPIIALVMHLRFEQKLLEAVHYGI